MVPGFQTDRPPQVSLNDHHALESKTLDALQNDAASFLSDASNTRPYFQVDLEKDPIISNSESSIQNPGLVLNNPLYNREPQQSFEAKICRESKPGIEVSCSKSLLPPSFYVEPPKYSHYWCTSGMHPRPDDPRCEAKAYYPTPRMYEPERVHITKETWTSTCKTLEDKVKAGICRLVRKECPGGRETREVVGTMSGRSVTRSITKECWREVFVYTCTYPSPNTCEPLRKNSCEQMASECLNKIGEVCVEWSQTYRCPQDGAPTQFIKKEISPPYGDLQIPFSNFPKPQKSDLNQALSKLSILKEIQDDLRASGSSASIPLIFKGCSKACTIAFAGFNNCCSRDGGWGADLGLSGCSGEEKDLATRKEKGLCHEIGTYCAEKIAGVCIRKKRRSCCFPSKLARILHEQGRAQLGLSWGSAEDPECRGFSESEIASLNFDRLDLSEIYAEVQSRIKNPSEDVVKRNLSTRMNQITHHIHPRKEGM